MENIEEVKKKYISFFAKKYYDKSKGELTEREMSTCSLIAEVWAYVYTVIPDGFGEYSIFDFNGCVVGNGDSGKNNNLPLSIALAAKEQVCRYCWGMSWDKIKEQYSKDNDIEPFLRKHSIMMERFSKGGNIAIFGASDKPIGRTMLASIVMKEAIRLRATHFARGQTYDWIDFPKLFSIIEKESPELSDYRSCDWLVVDNITRKMRSARQTTLMIDLIDPFFIERYSSRQPTILVFKFDIRDKSLDIENTFGLGISRILDSKRTLKIPLCENLMSIVNE